MSNQITIIVQKGSNITAERMRFDFNYPDKLSDEQIKAVEDEVNKNINALSVNNLSIIDINGDGLPDLVVHPRLAKGPKAFLGNGQGQWLDSSEGLRMNVSCGGGLQLADVDNDGKPEILFGAFNGDVWALNGEDGSVRWTVNLGTSSYIQSEPSIADLDGNGQLDLVVAPDVGAVVDDGVAQRGGSRGDDLDDGLHEPRGRDRPARAAPAVAGPPGLLEARDRHDSVCPGHSAGLLPDRLARPRGHPAPRRHGLRPRSRVRAEAPRRPVVTGGDRGQIAGRETIRSAYENLLLASPRRFAEDDPQWLWLRR
jgi:hypothetical protein